jgi:hypothetical protein
MLRLEILRTVLPDDLDACVREQGEIVERDVLRRDDDRDAAADFLSYADIPLAQRLNRRRQ